MRLPAALLVAAISMPAVARPLWFDPPNPTSRNSVVAHFATEQFCGPTPTTVSKTSNSIAITLPFGPICGPRVAPEFFISADLGILPAGVYHVTAAFAESPAAPFAEATLAVEDADPPLVVQPNAGVETMPVVVSSNKILSCEIVDPCPLPVIEFDGVPATGAKFTGVYSVSVLPPAHAAGIVDVTMQQSGSTFVSHAAFDYVRGAAPEPSFFERILTPVATSGPGAFGSVWDTELAVHNGNSFPLAATLPPLDANASSISRLTGFPSGKVDFVSRQAMPGTSFSLLVRDLSRDATDFGTAIPIVREHDFFDRTFSIVNVPADPRYRVALRLYAYDDAPTLSVNIVSLKNAPVLLAESRITLQTVDRQTHAFAYIGDLLTQFPQVAGQGPLRIEISGGTPTVPAWGFVSITNNATQHITVMTPE